MSSLPSCWNCPHALCSPGFGKFAIKEIDAKKGDKVRDGPTLLMLLVCREQTIGWSHVLFFGSGRRNADDIYLHPINIEMSL